MIDGVSFRYREEQPPLYENFSLSDRGRCLRGVDRAFRQRQKHARAAAAGLSICRPAAASRLTGRDTRQLPANELRLLFGVVPQETRLFSGTLFDNLVAGQPHATLSEVAGRLPPGGDS